MLGDSPLAIFVGTLLHSTTATVTAGSTIHSACRIKHVDADRRRVAWSRDWMRSYIDAAADAAVA